MRKSDLTIFPEPGNKMRLISKGPYKIIRHPMYTALFIIFIPFLIYDFTFIRLGVMVIFTINQVLKLFYEEKLLDKRDSGYRKYMNKTWRLVPYIF
jgi:protein-S-isoprenylcysteine O-methyltransferase Ste14